MRERTDGQGFATRAIHAGERPDPDDPRAQHPDLRDRDVRVRHGRGEGGGGRRARSSGTRPRTSTAGPATRPTGRSRRRSRASRAPRTRRRRVGHGERRGDAVRAPGAGRPHRRGRRAVRDHDGAVAGGPAAARDRRDGGRHDGPRGGRGGHHGPRRSSCSWRRRRTRGCGSPDLAAISALAHRHGLIVVADNTFLGAGAPAADRARRRPRPPRRDEVPLGSRRRGLGRGVGARSTSSTRSASRRTRSARRRARSTRSSCCAACGRSRSARRRARRTPLALARFLEADERVDWVRYPGLASHPDHEVATRLLGDRCGAMVTFAAARRRRGHGRLHRPPPRCATSASAWATCSRSSTRGRRTAGSSACRVGCEDIDDLVEDFKLGLSFVA